MMKVTVTNDKEHAKKIRDAIQANGGYCPCRIQKTEDTKCMCKEFRDQICDPSFTGYCHCRLYLKYEE